VGRIADAPDARLSCFVPSERDLQVPQSPPELAKRVSKMEGAEFRTQGLKMFTDLMDQMTRLGIHATGRILDWGCGCGRVASHLPARLGEAKLIGCDIDAQAIEWCRQHIAGEFMRVDPHPPTPFGDAAADVIVACSVLTHLGAQDQERWLREMHRVLAPGGSFLASTNGDFTFQLARGRGRWAKVRSAWTRLTGAGTLCGIRDTQLDRTLSGIAPRGYYRAVFQSRAYTIDTYSKYFQVLDYVERGLNGHQDLVILRRAA
jgi:SAM-dependent methyltransferase